MLKIVFYSLVLAVKCICK